MKTLRLIVLLAAVELSAFLSASAQTVDDTLRQIREAGLEGIAGTMPENASLLGSFAFERLERKLPGIYGSAKQTFRLAGDSWDQERNAGKAPSAPREELGHTLRIMLRNQFLYQVEAFLPDLSRGVYSEADRRRIKELLVGTPPPADGTLQTPNNALAEHFKAYLQNLLIDSIPEPQPIFERLLGPLDKRGDGAPLGGGLAPKWGRLSLAIKSGGAFVQSVEIKIKYLRAGIGGHEQEDSFHTNPGIYVVPTGKWNVTAESAGLASQTQEAEIREGAVTTVAFALTAAPAPGTPTASRGNRSSAASRAVAPLSPGELALIGHYQRAGAKVVDFDPQALARAWQALPDNYPDILRPHSQLLATMLTPRGGRGFAADMTGHAANPALNDPRLMVKLEAVRNGQPAEIAVETAKFTEDIVWCVSQWVNAMRNLTETTFEPLANIQVNDAFFTRVEAR